MRHAGPASRRSVGRRGIPRRNAEKRRKKNESDIPVKSFIIEHSLGEKGKSNNPDRKS